MDTSPRPLRADAERNRQAILCAAGTLFAEEGVGVTLERIAAAAGVGVGTIYRRYATVDALIAVVLEEKMRRYADRTEEAAVQALEDPWEAFRDWVLFIVEQQATDLAFGDVTLSGEGSALFRSETRRALRASLTLVARARAAGAIRPDFHHTDLILLQHANAGLVRTTHHEAPEAWRRFADYMLQSFRVSGGPLADPPAVWMRPRTT
ncbi:TetR/AcrR family transcriptional regulator [Rathayibacter caricis DSM 15933]|uniref:TetR/AcrR family transcriptional regulator n=1 Tax=Rathayibacter caricis DSM 15933 TaxID=1328867 RepID=A0A2T4UQV0_9MICO|nr:TetR/AcrR family transcriptional regulator [Rathayibacter caricis]PTL71910.1 TetR/AcrR family transcriptional regulator [Rathayibacter caricis DSM 15933]